VKGYFDEEPPQRRRAHGEMSGPTGQRSSKALENFKEATTTRSAGTVDAGVPPAGTQNVVTGPARGGRWATPTHVRAA
jgi:hypothetical protein